MPVYRYATAPLHRFTEAEQDELVAQCRREARSPEEMAALELEIEIEVEVCLEVSKEESCLEGAFLDGKPFALSEDEAAQAHEDADEYLKGQREDYDADAYDRENDR